jgi:hypothetical protein
MTLCVSQSLKTLGLALGIVVLTACANKSADNLHAAVSQAWLDAPLLAPDNEWGAYDYEIGHDAQGNALAVWEQFDGTRYNIWTNRKPAGKGWGVARLMATDKTGAAYSPQIAVDARGNAMAVWQQSDGQYSYVYASRYVLGTGWSQVMQIATDPGSAIAPQVAVDASGNAVALWQQFDGRQIQLRASHYAMHSGWGASAPSNFSY